MKSFKKIIPTSLGKPDIAILGFDFYTPFMSIPDVSLHPYDPGTPVFRPGEFVGREGLVRNLLWRLGRGESLSIFGGPKLGKTSLLLHLAWQLDQSSLHTQSGGVSVVYFDLAKKTDYEQLLSQQHAARSIVLLDNCDLLVGKGSPLVLQTKGLSTPVIVYAGGREWREFMKSGGLREKVHSVPLAMFLEKEARLVFDKTLTTEQQADLLQQAGTHPFALKVLQARLVANHLPISRNSTVENEENTLPLFFHRCLDQLREPMEHAVLVHLIQAAKPVNPREVARVVGLPTIKPFADTLCYLGLISRWIRNEEATLSASCALFNERYLETVASSANKGREFGAK